MIRINNIEIEPIKTKALPPLNRIKGGSLFGKLYTNALLLAPKNSGKTTIIMNIIKHCVNRNTSLIFFVATHNKDDSYEAIFKHLDDNGINYTTYDDIIEDGVNVLNELLNQMLAHVDDDKKPKPKPMIHTMEGLGRVQLFQPIEQPKKRVKKIAPRFCFVFDDMASQCRNMALTRLLKIHRHLKASVFISVQSISDLTPSAILQIDVAILFRGLRNNIKKLEHIYTNLDIQHISFEEFLRIYREATENPYNFLWVSKNGEFRRNFNYRFNLED